MNNTNSNGIKRNEFNGVKVFSATQWEHRERLGDVITDWLRERPHITVVDKLVTQSSDERFHCLAITIFYNEPIATANVNAKTRRKVVGG